MVTITYDALNELVHNVAYEIEKTTGFNKDTVLDLFALNDTMTQYLDRYGVQYVDEEIEVALDPKVEAISNIRMAISRIGPMLGSTYETPELNEVYAELDQAVRFLTGEESPS